MHQIGADFIKTAEPATNYGQLNYGANLVQQDLKWLTSKLPPPPDVKMLAASVVKIDYDACINCGSCIRSYPVDVLRINKTTRIL